MKISTLMAVVLVTLFSAGAAMADAGGGGGGGGMPDPQTMGLPNGGTVEVPQIVPFDSVPPSSF